MRATRQRSEEILQVASAVDDSDDFYGFDSAFVGVGVGFVENEVWPMHEQTCGRTDVGTPWAEARLIDEHFSL
jgi:hypothetical protein